MSEDKNLGNSELNAADELTNAPQEQQPVEYTDDNIRHLSDMEHVRTRPGMYIGRLGDGNLPEDGIYVLLKEVVDNSIDEFKMGAGARLEIDIEDNLRVSVRDYGRGIPQGKLVEAVSVLNTGGKYDSKAFKKSVGLNGVGVKAVNALSSHFEVKSYRDGKVRHLKFEKGILKSDTTEDTEDENGTFIFFEPDNTLFKNYSFHDDFVETMLRNYTYLNTGLTIMHNGRRILSRSLKIASTIILKVEDKVLHSLLFQRIHRYCYLFMTGKTKASQSDVSDARTNHISRIHRSYRNLIALYLKDELILDATAHDGKIYRGSLRTTKALHDFLLAHLHARNGSIVYSHNAVAGNDSHLLGRSVRNRLDNEQRIIYHVKLHANAIKTAVQRLVHRLGFLGCGVRRMRVELFEHASDGVLYEFILIHTIHIEVGNGDFRSSQLLYRAVLAHLDAQLGTGRSYCQKCDQCYK